MAFNPFRGGEFGDEDSYSAGKRKDPGEWAMQEKPVPKVYGSTKDIDVDKALADQFAEAEAYRDHLLNNDKMYMPNHVTGAITAVNRIIDQIVKIREAVQNLARMQVFESVLIDVMKEQPSGIKDQFFAELEKRLNDVH